MRHWNFEEWLFAFFMTFLAGLLVIASIVIGIVVGIPKEVVYYREACAEAGGQVVNSQINTYCIDKKVFLKIEPMK